MEEPGLRRWWERLGSIARVILVDRRGVGLSDRHHGTITLEQEVADLDAVLDDAGCDRVVLQSYAAGGPLAIEYAATRPDRTLALVLYASVDRDRARAGRAVDRGAARPRGAAGEAARHVGDGREPRAPRAVAGGRRADARVDGPLRAPVRDARGLPAPQRQPRRRRRPPPPAPAARPDADPAPHRRQDDRRRPLADGGAADPGRAAGRAARRGLAADGRRQRGAARRAGGVPDRLAHDDVGAAAAADDDPVHRHRRRDRPRRADGRRALARPARAPTTPRSTARWSATAGARSRRSATATWPRSRDRRRTGCAAPGRSWPRCAGSGSSCAPGCTRGSAS